MRRYLISTVLSVLSLLPTLGLAAELVPFSAVYTVKMGIITIGETRRELSATKDGTYLFESITVPKGMAKMLTSGQVIERSQWKPTGDTLVPLAYTYFNSGTKKNRNVRISFDWENRVIVNNINGDLWQMGLEDGTQDKLLYQLSIMKDLAEGETDLKYPVADGGRLKTYHFEWKGVETIKTPAGTFDTVRLRRMHGKTTTTIWCAAKLGFLPVRIQQQKRDEGPSTATLTSVVGLGSMQR